MGNQILDYSPLRERLYNELMDIFYAECFTKMLCQSVGRHWERDWLQGWFYNPSRPGYYVYDLWKEDVIDVVRDLSVDASYNATGPWTKTVKVTSNGEAWEYFDLYEKVLINGTLIRFTVEKGWLPPSGQFTREETISGIGNLTYLIWVEISDWKRTEHMDPIPDSYPEDNYVAFPLKYGDIGGGLPPQFFSFDGIVDGKDLALFIECFKGLAPLEAMYLGDLGGGVPLQFFNFDGVVDGKDLALFLMCYKELGPK
jgi:hypothetical protein